jgi:hypothetical protein
VHQVRTLGKVRLVPSKVPKHPWVAWLANALWTLAVALNLASILQRLRHLQPARGPAQCGKPSAQAAAARRRLLGVLVKFGCDLVQGVPGVVGLDLPPIVDYVLGLCSGLVGTVLCLQDGGAPSDEGH